jgi:PEP-CTERM motif
VTHKFAKLLTLAIGALALSAVPALATTCAGGEVVSTGFTCSLGGLTFDFSSVQFIPSTGDPAPVLELDALTGISGDDYTLDFAVSVGADPAADDLLLDYTVSGGSFTQVDNGYLASGYEGQGLIENVYTDSTMTTRLATLDNSSGTEEYSTTFGPVGSVFIAKDFNGLTSEFNDSIVSTPEPSSLGLMLMGAFGIGLISRKFRRA